LRLHHPIPDTHAPADDDVTTTSPSPRLARWRNIRFSVGELTVDQSTSTAISPQLRDVISLLTDGLLNDSSPIRFLSRIVYVIFQSYPCGWSH